MKLEIDLDQLKNKIVRDGAACFPERGVFFSDSELGTLMNQGPSRQMIDGIFKLKEVFRGEVLTCEGGLSNR